MPLLFFLGVQLSADLEARLFSLDPKKKALFIAESARKDHLLSLLKNKEGYFLGKWIEEFPVSLDLLSLKEEHIQSCFSKLFPSISCPAALLFAVSP